MSFQTREMNGGSSRETTMRSFQSQNAPRMSHAENVFLPPLEMSFPTTLPQAVRKTGFRMTPQTDASVNFRVEDSSHLQNLFAGKHKLEDFHTGLVNHTEAINVLADTIHNTHAKYENMSAKMADGDGFMHKVFENHTGVLNHLVRGSDTVNDALGNHQDNLVSLHNENTRNKEIIRMQTKELNDLRMQIEDKHGMFHTGLANHTTVLRRTLEDVNDVKAKAGIYNTKVDTHAALITQTAGDLFDLQQDFSAHEGTLKNHVREIGTVNEKVNNMHLGMIHHTEMLSGQVKITDSLQQSQGQLESQLDNLELALKNTNTNMSEIDVRGQILDIKRAVNANAALLNDILSQSQADQTRGERLGNTEEVSMNQMLSSAPRRR